MKGRFTLSGFARVLAGAALLASAIGVGSACEVSARGRLYVDADPPPPMVEVRTVAPGPDFVWVSGFYQWNGGRYAWVPGRWDRPPRRGARWEPAHWARHGRDGWYMVDGHWR